MNMEGFKRDLVKNCICLCLGDCKKLNTIIVSVYSPSHRAPVEIKDQFFDDLQAVISSTSSDDLLLRPLCKYGEDVDGWK